MAVNYHQSVPVVAPKYVDGKYIKKCECGCGVEFEVSPRARGNQRYSKPCGKRIRAEYLRQQHSGIGEENRRCRLCGEIKPLSEFPKSRNSDTKKMSSCKECLPYTSDNTRYLPSCGDYNSDNEDFSKSDSLCPLYSECMVRLKAGVWLPCHFPSRAELVMIVFAPENEKKGYYNMVQHKLLRDGSVKDDNIDNYLERYRK